MAGFRIEREADAKAIASALTALYPAYRLEPFRPKRCRRWRLSIHDAHNGAYLAEAQQ